MGYILLGMLFIMIVYRKEVRHRKLPLEHRKKFGIPQHFGMYYAMGVALIMEGIMYVLITCFHEFVLFLTEEASSHGGLRTRELGQAPSC